MFNVSDVANGVRVVGVFDGDLNAKTLKDTIITNPNGKYVILEITNKPTIKETMLKLGINTAQIGASYLEDAVAYGLRDWESLDMITKMLYPDIAKKNGTNPAHVERAIRVTIEAAWNKADMDFRERVFGSLGIEGARRPSNSTYIKCIVSYLK